MGTREHVYGVLGYYDGVLDGVADFDGKPHSFVLDDDVDSPAPVYRLAPLSSEAMRVFEEAWQIWRRWENANRVSKDPPDTIAALADDRERHAELEPLLKQMLRVPIEASFPARGTFLRRANVDLERDGPWAMDVEWSEP